MISNNPEPTSTSDSLAISPQQIGQNTSPELLEPDTFIDSHGCKRYKANGRLCKGYTANPLGAPPRQFVSQQLNVLLSKANGSNSKKIAKRLIKIALASQNERNATYASEVIMDRTEGKPMQSLQVTQTIDDTAANRFADLAERLANLAR